MRSKSGNMNSKSVVSFHTKRPSLVAVIEQQPQPTQPSARGTGTPLLENAHLIERQIRSHAPNTVVHSKAVSPKQRFINAKSSQNTGLPSARVQSSTNNSKPLLVVTAAPNQPQTIKSSR